MKALLMAPERDFALHQPLPWNADELAQDLELETLLQAMAQDNQFIHAVAQRAMLCSLSDIDTLRYRQQALRDCLRNAQTVRGIYRLAAETVEKEGKHFHFNMRHPGIVLHRAIEVLQMFVEQLRSLRGIADRHSGGFRSGAFTRFFAMVRAELDDAYFEEIRRHLQELKFRDGVLISARLGPGNKGVDYALRLPNEDQRGWINRLFSRGPPTHTFHIHPRDEAGGRALSELEDRGKSRVADALNQSTAHISSFFYTVRTELAFYVGALNLHERLRALSEPICYPDPAPSTQRRLDFDNLYDPCLALNMEHQVVGNSVHERDKDLVMITGANQGGKSTFLRSIGLTQLMMQCGLFVPAESFAANVCTGLCTHYKREEDTTMENGKFDEELRRMSDIADHLQSGAMVLFNESFSATNEREGSEIARQIVSALLDKRIAVFFVTHFYEPASAFHDDGRDNALFLRAERNPDGSRTFKLMASAPFATSYGQDIYERIFDDKTPPLSRPA